jgi:hypothetical protein
MDNTNQPPGGEPQDFWATQEIRPAAGQPEQAGQAGQPGQPSGPDGAGWGQPAPGPGWGQSSRPSQQPGWGQPSGQAGYPSSGHAGYHPAGGRGGPGGHGGAAPSGPRPPRRSKRIIWGAGLALVAVLAGGGAFAASQLAGSSSPAASVSGPTGQAAQLNALLDSASSPASAAAAASFAAGTSGSGASASGTSHPCLTRAAKLLGSGHPHEARVALQRCRHPLRGVRLVGGIHGQFTFKTKSGYKTLAYERGQIESISGSDVTVQAVDGTTWTWAIVSNTVVREGGKKVATSQLSDGQQVFAGGPVVSGVYDARLIVIRPAATGTTPAPSPSPASGS